MSDSGRPIGTGFVPYPPIAKHGAIGDRRTAALVAADGTVDWLCLPDYDGTIVFGTLLDADRAGFWRFGPRELIVGSQRYRDNSAVLSTTWSTAAYELEMLDFMEGPETDRSDRPGDRSLVRLLRCHRGTPPASSPSEHATRSSSRPP